MTGAELKAWRERHKLSQLDVAYLLGRISLSSVWQWETGRARVPQYLPLALKELERQLVAEKEEKTA